MISLMMVACTCCGVDLWGVQFRSRQRPIKLKTAAYHKWSELLPHLPSGSPLHGVELDIGATEHIARRPPPVTIAYRINKLAYGVVICSDLVETSQNQALCPGALDPLVRLQRAGMDGIMRITRLCQRLLGFEPISHSGRSD